MEHVTTTCCTYSISWCRLVNLIVSTSSSDSPNSLRHSTIFSGCHMGCCYVLQWGYPLPQLREISRSGQEMMQKVESSPKPVVAAINGSCLGGGLEVSFNWGLWSWCWKMYCRVGYIACRHKKICHAKSHLVYAYRGHHEWLVLSIQCMHPSIRTIGPEHFRNVCSVYCINHGSQFDILLAECNSYFC